MASSPGLSLVVEPLAAPSSPPVLSPSGSPSLAAPAADGPAPTPPPAGGRARLAIRRVQLENFKSYGGTVTVGPFHKRFSAIVGPNGSGKSNVIDAMLFVFGKRAKQMRLSKVSELLHNSATHPNVTAATVTVDFHEITDTGDGDDDYTVLPGSSFSVSRTALKNNSSRYALDGRTVTFGEVNAVLRRKGVDLEHNRFLILQGEVEQIAMLRPKAPTPHDTGLLEYLEDIIGSSAHVPEIERLAAEVDTLNEERLAKLHLAKAVERERDGLVGAKDEAEAFLALEGELADKRVTLLRDSLAGETVTAATIFARRDALQARVDAQRAEMSTAAETIKALDKRHAGEKKKYDAAATAATQAHDAAVAIERKDIQLGEAAKHLAAKEKKQAATAEREGAKAEAADADAATHSAAAEAASTDVSAAQAGLTTAEAALQAHYDRIRGETEPLRRQVEAAQRALMPHTGAVHDAQRAVDVAVKEVDLLASQLAAPQRAQEAAAAEVDAVARELTAARGRLATAESDAAMTATGVANADAARSSTASALTDVEARIPALRVTVERGRAAVAERSTRSRLFAALADEPSLRIVGRLADLASVDAKYDVAVGAAAGGTLDNIVVHTAADATACVQFLRARGLGRATFIILEKMRYLERSLGTPSGAALPRLFDLLGPPAGGEAAARSFATVRTAFYYALRDTLVADTLDAATREAFKPTRRTRVVTLAGELVEPSGAMSGGGSGAPRFRLGGGGGGGGAGGSAEDASPARIAAASKELDAALAELTRLRCTASSAEAAVTAARSAADAASTAVEGARLEVASAEARATAAARDLEVKTAAAGEAASAATTDRHAALTASLPRLRDAVAAAKECCAAHEAEIASLQAQVMAVGGAELEAAKTDVATVTVTLDAASTAASTAAVKAETAKRAGAKAAAAAQRAAAAAATAADERTRIEAERAGLEAQTADLVAAQEAAEATLADRKRDLDAIAAERAEAASSVAAHRAAEVDLVAQLDTEVRAATEARRRVSSARKRLAGVRKQQRRLAAELDAIDEDEDSGEDGAAGGGEGGVEDPAGGTSRGADSANADEDGMDVDASTGRARPGSSSARKRRKTPAKKKRRRRQSVAASAAGSGDEDPDKASGDDEEEGEEAEGAGRDKEGEDGDDDDDAPEDEENVDDVVRMDAAERKTADAEIKALEARVAAMKVNIGAIKQYRRKERECRRRMSALEAATAARDTVRRNCEAVRRARLEEFMAGFSAITLKLKEMYQMITLGGDAELELVDSLDPFSEGVVFSVRPPKKSWKNISNLSGGEKTLSSLALVFALHHYKPTPLYFMDEIDAALDFKNVSIVANYVKERTKDAQFIIISLRNNMFELADRLVGIYKTFNSTKSVTINPHAFALPAVVRPGGLRGGGTATATATAGSDRQRR